MKIYDLHDEAGRLVAFEIDNGWLQPRGIRRLVGRLSEARLLPPSPAGSVEGERCRFEFAGEPFLVVEPFGDNSRYWVGPETVGSAAALGAVRAVFAGYQPATWFRLARFAAGLALLGGCCAIVLFRFVGLPEYVAMLGVGGLVGGALAVLVLQILAVLGLIGSSGREVNALAHGS